LLDVSWKFAGCLLDRVNTPLLTRYSTVDSVATQVARVPAWKKSAKVIAQVTKRLSDILEHYFGSSSVLM